MPAEVATSATASEQPIVRRTTGSRVRAVADLLLGVLLPTALLVQLASSNGFGPAWQSGNPADFALMLLNGLHPLTLLLVGYSVTSIVFVLVSPKRFGQLKIVRFGVYTGFVIALSVALLTAWSILRELQGEWTFGIACILNIAWVTWLVSGPLRRPWLWAWLGLVLVTTGVEIITLYTQSPPSNLGDKLIGLLLVQVFVLVFSAPWISTVVFSRYGLSLAAAYGQGWRFRLIDLLGIASWTSAYLGAWRAAYVSALEAYAKLPTTDPNCYVATAAARGHRRFVGSWMVRASSSELCRVNQQLLRLKAAEIALATVAPRVHARIRAIYNWLGPRLARLIRSPWAADLAYLTLKPAEILVTAVLRRVLPNIDERAQRLVRD